MSVAYDRGSALLSRLCNRLCISNFIDEDFSVVGQLVDGYS